MTNRTTAHDGTEIAWERVGAGDPVVLVHGITESRGSWTPIVDRLAGDHEVLLVDLRGHGESSSAATYELADMARDVHAVIADAGIAPPHLVGHSLGGAVVSAAGALGGARSVTDIDQSLLLSAFTEQIRSVEGMLRDADAFGAVIAGLFEQLAGPALPPAERERVGALRRPDQHVVLGVWRVLLESSVAEIDAAIDAALAGYRAHPTPYLAIMGADPGDGDAAWLVERVPGATVELWPDHGHYPHLVDPDRTVARLREFWTV